MRRVGILGGMGPQATVLLMQRLLDVVRATDDADHIPLIVDQNPQVPSRIQHLIEGTGADPAPVLADMARRLVTGGAMALAMPCNTAHHFAPAIKAVVSVPLIDMVDLSVAHAASLTNGQGCVGILASPAVRKIGLFDARLARAGVRAIYPEDESALLAAIRQIKAAGPRPESAAVLRSESEALLRKGAFVQMIACTEFSLLTGCTAPEATAFDTLDVLVAAIKEFATGSQLSATEIEPEFDHQTKTRQQRRPA